MDILTFIQMIVSSITWPIFLLIFILILKKPIIDLIPNTSKIKYGRFEIEFSDRVKKIKNEEGVKDLRSTQIPEDLMELARLNPRSAVLESWIRIEAAAKEKEQLILHTYKNKRLDIISQIEYGRILSPSFTNIIRGLRRLRNDLVHANKAEISEIDAIEYIKLSMLIIMQIEGLIELPQIKLTALTLLILELNHLLDTQKYNDITVEDIKNEIEKENVLDFLATRAKDDIDLSIFLKTNTYDDFKKRYNDIMKNILDTHSGDERRKWGVENSGICLLIAWTNEVIQQGHGWYPDI